MDLSIYLCQVDMSPVPQMVCIEHKSRTSA